MWVNRGHHKLLHNPPRGFRGLVEYSTGQEPHFSEKAVMSDTPEMVEGSQQPKRSRTVEQYTTDTKTTVSSRIILLHVVPVRVIAPQGNSITTYGLLDNASQGTIISKNIARILHQHSKVVLTGQSAEEDLREGMTVQV